MTLRGYAVAITDNLHFVDLPVDFPLKPKKIANLDQSKPEFSRAQCFIFIACHPPDIPISDSLRSRRIKNSRPSSTSTNKIITTRYAALPEEKKKQFPQSPQITMYPLGAIKHKKAQLIGYKKKVRERAA